ncbi:hypothetical protein [Nocardia brasiliensis]|uniref:hypothetical protein n=1 Tax=Nocardia brasiliensis TaxID=37326 RepID=UPI00114CA718|nr:hypothetical protein [Nocardia brasiliensis]
MAGGFYNHYDDPDEFWDEEPLRPTTKPAPEPQSSYGNAAGRPPASGAPSPPFTPEASPSRPVPASRGTAGSVNSSTAMTRLGITPPPKSSLISVDVADDRLPKSIKLGRDWKYAFTPAQYGQSIVEAYRYGMYEWAARTVESGELPPSTIPSLRTAAPLLLRTRSIDEYRVLYDQLFLETPIQVQGPGRDAFGQSALTVRATWSKLISITIDPDWAAGIEADFIAQDILDCCQQIRAKKPRPIIDSHFTHVADDELASQVLEHEQYLLTYS